MLLNRKWDRVGSHAFSTALDGSANWPWSMEGVGIKDPATDAQTENESRRRLGGIQEEDVERHESPMKEDPLPLPAVGEKKAEKVWKTMAWAFNDGDEPVMDAPRSILHGQSFRSEHSPP